MKALSRSSSVSIRVNPWQCCLSMIASIAIVGSAAAQGTLPPLPDSTGWGVHVLSLPRDARGAIWPGTHGRGIYRLPVGATAWESIRHDSTETSISWDFVQALAFGARGQIWYGTLGNGWGMSTDGGATWKNWAFKQLGPEWQYVTPSGIVIRGDTTVIGTADGLQLTTNDGGNWAAIGDALGPKSRGPADTVFPVLRSEYVRRVAADRRGWNISTLRGSQRLRRRPAGWQAEQLAYSSFPPANTLLIGNKLIRGTNCGLRPNSDTLPCFKPAGPAADAPKAPLTTWFRRPIALTDNSYIDQTYRYGSTMGGNFQQHQGVEFNNPDGTPVYAIGAGTVVYAGPAEQGALTVTIRHDTTVRADGKRYRIFSTYYHNSFIKAKLGQRVTKGALIARVGNTG